MTSDPQRAPISGARRVARLAMAAGLVAALSAAGPIPMAFSADSGAPTADPGTKSATAKLGSSDADLLAEAKADGDKNVTMMIATAPGQTEQVTKELDAVKGGSVGRSYDKLGYVRATVPTGRADATNRRDLPVTTAVPLPARSNRRLARSSWPPTAASRRASPAARPCR